MSQIRSDKPFEAIAEKIVPDGQLVRHWPLTGGVSAQVDALEVRPPGERSRVIVVRNHGTYAWKPRENDIATTEFALLRALFEAGLPVPEPLLLDTSSTILPSSFFVMEMVEGSTVVEPDNLPSAIAQMADFLAHLHALNIDVADSASLRHLEDPVAGALEYIPNTPEWTALRAIVAKWGISPVKDSLLHGDYWPGNVLWHEGRLAAVIDWEDASIGTAVSDLACARAELMVLYDESIVEQFTKRYLTKADLDLADLPLWEVYSGFAALASMGDWGLAPEVEAARRAQTTLFVHRACREILA